MTEGTQHRRAHYLHWYHHGEMIRGLQMAFNVVRGKVPRKFQPPLLSHLQILRRTFSRTKVRAGHCEALLLLFTNWTPKCIDIWQWELVGFGFAVCVPGNVVQHNMTMAQWPVKAKQTFFSIRKTRIKTRRSMKIRHDTLRCTHNTWTYKDTWRYRYTWIYSHNIYQDDPVGTSFARSYFAATYRWSLLVYYDTCYGALYMYYFWFRNMPTNLEIEMSAPRRSNLCVPYVWANHQHVNRLLPQNLQGRI